MQAIGIDVWNGNSAQVQIFVSRGATYPIAMSGGAYGAQWGFFFNDRHSFAVVDGGGIIRYISQNSIGYPGRYQASKAAIIATIEQLLMTSDVEQVEDNSPSSFVLSQNYPNPFRGETFIQFQVPAQDNGRVKLSIFNLLGQEVRVLVDQNFAGGTYRAAWDGRDAADQRVVNGIYFYKLQAKNFAALKRLVILQ